MLMKSIEYRRCDSGVWEVLMRSRDDDQSEYPYPLLPGRKPRQELVDWILSNEIKGAKISSIGVVEFQNEIEALMMYLAFK